MGDCVCVVSVPLVQKGEGGFETLGLGRFNREVGLDITELSLDYVALIERIAGVDRDVSSQGAPRIVNGERAGRSCRMVGGHHLTEKLAPKLAPELLPLLDLCDPVEGPHERPHVCLHRDDVLVLAVLARPRKAPIRIEENLLGRHLPDERKPPPALHRILSDVLSSVGTLEGPSQTIE